MIGMQIPPSVPYSFTLISFSFSQVAELGSLRSGQAIRIRSVPGQECPPWQQKPREGLPCRLVGIREPGSQRQTERDYRG